MSVGTTQPLNLLHIDFQGLYERHLGRHSQWGINIAHLVALYMIWFGIYATITQTVRHLGLPGWPVATAMALAYLLLVSTNIPFRVTVVTAIALAVFVASVLALPLLPAWAAPLFLLLIPAGYKFQRSNHDVWTLAADMTEFNKRFPPGRDLSLILATYEVPTCLYFLVFRRQDWKR